MNILNKIFFLLVIGAISVTVSFRSASALTMQATINYGTRHSGNGGEFNISSADFNPTTMGYAANTISGGGFETFCVEANEYFTPGSAYYYAISQAAVNGGISGGNPDPISLGTAFLYSQFAKGTLGGYDYGTLGGSSASAGSLQATIWWLEGEASDPGTSNIFRDAVLTQFGTVAGAMADSNGAYGVGVLNLWVDHGHTKVAQDQLVLVPEGGSTLILLGFGLVSLYMGGRKLERLS